MSGVAKKLMSAAGAGGDVGAWDLSYAYYDPPESAVWNVSTAVYANKSFSVAGQETVPNAVFFKPDGTKMYVLGSGTGVHEYNISTAWDVSTATLLQSLNVLSQDNDPQSVFFKADGTKMYVVGTQFSDVNEYDLSTAWNISTASFLQAFSVTAQQSQPNGMYFRDDGLKMYIVGADSEDYVHEYSLSTAWDVSSSTYIQRFSVNAQEGTSHALFFKSDGTKMYVVGVDSDNVNEYNLSVAWDISTASFLQSFSVSSQETLPTGVFFKPDGTAMYLVGRTGDDVNQYTLGGFSVAAQETTSTGIFFKPDGTKMYIVGEASPDDVNEYNLSTAWDVSSATYLQSFSFAAQETDVQDIFFKPDGTKMYIVGKVGDDVNEYDLSTAWDVTTASFIRAAAQGTDPIGLFFKPDGTKMYSTSQTGNNVNEYNLSTAWDISTATFLQSFSVDAQETNPAGLFFKPDGEKMYVLGATGDDVNEYDLSTAWDVSTATFLQSFPVAAQELNPQGLFFKPDGTKMYVVGTVTDRVYSYTLGVQP